MSRRVLSSCLARKPASKGSGGVAPVMVSVALAVWPGACAATQHPRAEPVGTTRAPALSASTTPSAVSTATPPAPRARGPFGIASDGRIDARGAEVMAQIHGRAEPLSWTETATACAILASCAPEAVAAWVPNRELGEVHPATVTAFCPEIASWFEERAIPVGATNDRWPALARAVLRIGLHCDAIKKLGSERPSFIECEEVGCWWDDDSAERPSVRCEGAIAILQFKDRTFRRNCASALTHCDAGSETGCGDRTPQTCRSPVLDRCDGPLKLGCDRTGRVSFHDCSQRLGGTCEQIEQGAGARCSVPVASECKPRETTCRGNVLTSCVDGHRVEVDCSALGGSGCEAGSSGAWCKP